MYFLDRYAGRLDLDVLQLKEAATRVHAILDQVSGGYVDPRHLRLDELVSTDHMGQHHLRPGEGW